MNIETHSNIYNLLYSIKLRELKIIMYFCQIWVLMTIKKNDNCNLKGLEKFPLIKKLSETYFCINIKYNNNIEANSSVYTYIFTVYKKIFRKILAQCIHAQKKKKPTDKNEICEILMSCLPLPVCRSK